MGMKRFNTTGKCNPKVHYMVNIDRQVEAAAKLVRQGDYFCINRGRQYGKTTTLSALAEKLNAEGYLVFPISFEGLGDEDTRSLERLSSVVVQRLSSFLKWEAGTSVPQEVIELVESTTLCGESISSVKFADFISELCNRRKVILMIDEVDQASNQMAFIQFLGILRDLFLKRDKRPTFQSVILAGVYDVKNLKLKIRPDDSHQYNSPWNIAVSFDSDMNLPAMGIAGMLEEYKNDHELHFDSQAVGQLIYDYTSGYPFLVSRICQIVDQDLFGWDKAGVLKAINRLLKEGNTLFDDMQKKLAQFPSLADILKSIIFGGQRVAYNYYDRDINIASMFNLVKDEQGVTKISCRIFETWLYDYFISQDKSSTIYQAGVYEKSQFFHDGYLDMRRLLERFCIHFNEIYRPGKDEQFVEENGRKIFLTYLRPIINGVGNYYCEAQTRDLTRTDIIVDFLGQQFVIELKIWRGNAYNERGEQQLCEYLDYYHLETGYLVSFCFNPNKRQGVKEVMVGNRKIIEAMV